MKNLTFKMSVAIVLAVMLAATLPVFACVSTSSDIGVADAAGETVQAKAAYVTDAACSVQMAAYNENTRLPIASMVKIMTALLIFEHMESGAMSPSDEVTVGENAASMGGSQIFLEANTVHKAGDLLKSIIIASANDSCVAMAEEIAGSERGFVARMNEKAAELGMTNTSFASCTGLPMPEQYSSAHDVAVMTSALLTHPAYFEYSQIWMEDYVHPDGRVTQMANTNKLLRSLKGCDGGKTGFTNEAMFCVSATAERDGMRVISVIIGAADGKTRFAEAARLLNEGFANYENRLVLSPETEVAQIAVKRGKTARASVVPAVEYRTVAKRGENPDVTVNVELDPEVKAPASAGDVVGKAVILRSGVVVSEVPLVLKDGLERGSLFDYFRHKFGKDE